MARTGESGELLKCSFCGKSQKQVQQLIAGPGVYICDECVELCNEIIDERQSEGVTKPSRHCRDRKNYRAAGALHAPHATTDVFSCLSLQHRAW